MHSVVRSCPGRKGVIGRQRCGSIGAREMHGAGVARGGIIRHVYRPYREIECRPGGGRERRRDHQERGWRSLHGGGQKRKKNRYCERSHNTRTRFS